MRTIIIKLSIIFIINIFFFNVIYAGSNSSSGCALDLDIATRSYTSDVSSVDIDTDILASIGDIIYVSIVGQGVSNLDTYQVEVKFDSTKLQFLEGYEDDPIEGIQNFLKSNGGITIGFQSVEKVSGVVNVSNTLSGRDTNQAPEGSGILAILKFEVLEDGPSKLILSDVHFVDSYQHDDLITKCSNTIVNNY